MEKFTKFADWESQKYNRKVEEDSTDTNKESEIKTQENAALIAQLADVVKARKEAIRNKDDFEAQILEIESKLIKLDIERNDLAKKKADLISARDISATERKEAKTNVKEN